MIKRKLKIKFKKKQWQKIKLQKLKAALLIL